MKKFKIVTDSGCDLSAEMINDLDIGYLGLICDLEGKRIVEDCGKSLSYKDFYEKVSAGVMPKTSQINPASFYDKFEGYLKDGYDILYIGFSSELSGTYNSALIAREELLEKYNDCNITLIDTKCASSGQGLLIYKAARLRDEGKTISEIAKELEIYKNKLYSFFTVKDLKHLERGGRISSTSAMVGSILNINPILEVTNAGRLDNVGKIRGEKKALKELVKKIDKYKGEADLEEVFISHADNDKAVEYLANLIKEEYNCNNIKVNYMGLAIGSHTGQGAVGIFFLGKAR